MKLHFKFNKENVNIKKYFSFLKHHYKKLIVFTIFMAPILLAISYYQSLKPETHLENFSSMISSNINESKYKNQNLSIYSKDSTTEGVKEFFPKTNLYNLGECFSNCTLVANQNITKDSVFISSGKNEVQASLVVPKTNWIIEKKNKFKLEFMDLEFYYKRTTYPQIFCYISDVYADKLVEERNYSGYDELIGDLIKLKYMSNGSLKETDCKISSIYKTNAAKGSYYYNLYGEFIITSFNYTWKIDNLALSFDLNKSIYNNMRVVKVLESKFALDEYNWNFVDNNTKSSNGSFDLNQEFLNYSTTNYDSLKKIGTITIILIVILAVSLYIYMIWMNRYFDTKQDNDEYKTYFRTCMLCYFLVFAIFYAILRIAKLSLYITSWSMLLWLFVGVYIAIFIIIPKLAKKKDNKNV